ncbi:histidine--tRNA ligase [Oceanithermus sp.]|uniref:histidine--tRNA ligase n=1 Tax=Oceanithermus sp. TaxID=2268145 RepID=UPI00257DF2A6|nr:histidine--tRNA ligase [Oceanithermus sp.]
MIRAVKGTHDLFGSALAYHRTVVEATRRWASAAGAEEIATPIFEHTEVFERGVGQTTDIVQKEMFSFSDRGQRSLTLRPEGTAGVVRAYIEHGMKVRPQPVRLWYAGPMFRAERPQKGRQRQFHQTGYEVIGAAEPEVDAEAVALSWWILADLGLQRLHLKLGSVGDAADRTRYNAYLRERLEPHAGELSEDSRRRLQTNPMRILDSKAEADRRLLEALEVRPMLEFLGEAARKHFEAVQARLRALGVPFEVDPTIVRGLDYYVRTSWEIHHELLGAQSALGGGGRYDGLSELLGGPTAPGVGWALGVERVALAMEAEGLSPAPSPGLDLYVVPLEPELVPRALEVAARFWPELRVQYALKARKPGKGLQEAEKKGARFAGLLGPDEAAAGTLTVKDLKSGEQRTLRPDEVKEWIRGGTA